jgi:hypothetical protein
MADDDIERAVEIATAIKRVARQPLLIELCDDVLVIASKLTAGGNGTASRDYGQTGRC